jgi:UDPglucose 6-dehydrogenase/UDP-N-acetyl-D-galactosamine dehydrogenase
MGIDLSRIIVCVVGAGFVGLPLSKAFAKKLRTITYDIDTAKVRQFSKSNKNPNHSFTSNPKQIAQADFVSICVPTPITKSKQPDMSYVRDAATVVGQNIKKGAVVILESSVYPGVTEEIVKPTVEKESGFKCGTDFNLGYSPERINPGDPEHDVDKVTKIVSASDTNTLELLAELYQIVTPNIFKAKDIRTAEAAKLVENTQRDLNIALVNELSIIFEKMGLSTKDVLDAAATKWNFQRFSPGLVGGYCIPVVPYFLVHKAEEYGYHPQVIMAGRSINDYMPKHIVEIAIKSMNSAGKVIKGSKVLIMGCTYKENVEDARETPVREVIKELHYYGINVWGYDPLIKDGEREFGIEFVKKLDKAPKMDCIILAAAHDVFNLRDIDAFRGIMTHPPILVDIRGFFANQKVFSDSFIYKCL